MYAFRSAASSLARGGVGLYLTAKLLMVLASRVILGSESHGNYDHILLSDGSASLQTFSFGLCPPLSPISPRISRNVIITHYAPFHDGAFCHRVNFITRQSCAASIKWN
jgi:hypothetical protein